MSNISLCLIAKNEAKTLPKLIESLGTFHGEIVVVDTGSTDNTVEVARNFGAAVYEVGDTFRVTVTESDLEKMNNLTALSPIMLEKDRPPKVGDSYFNFGAARNYALKMCTKDIIVAPDCDEVFVSVDWEAIEHHFTQGAEMLAIDIEHTYQNTNFIIDKTCIFTRWLFRCRYTVHENWHRLDNRRASVIKVPQKVAFLKHFKDIKKTRNYNLALMHSFALMPEDDHYIYHFARDLSHNQFYRESPTDSYLDCVKIIEPLIASIESEEPTDLCHYDCYAIIIYAYGLLLRNDRRYVKKIREYCFRSLSYAGLRVETYLQLAELFLQDHLYIESIIQINSALECIKHVDYNKISTKIPFLYKEHPYKLLYQACYLSGQQDEANFAYEKILTFAPSKPRMTINVHTHNSSLCLKHANALIKELRGKYPGALIDTLNLCKFDPFTDFSFVVGAHLIDTSNVAFYPNTVIYNYTPVEYFSRNSDYAYLLRNFKVQHNVTPPSVPSRERKVIVFDSGENVVWDPRNSHISASGAEIMTSELAKHFVRNNFQVFVFGSFTEEGEFEDVLYLNHMKYLPFVEENHVDYLIVSRYPDNIVYRDTIDNVFLWLHDTIPVHKKAPVVKDSFAPIHIDVSKFRGIICLSDWHKGVLLQCYPGIETKTNVFVSRNAIDMKKFHVPHSPKTSFRFIYTSYANRGLDMLLKVIPLVKQRYPQTELHIYCRDDDLLSHHARNIINTNDYITRFDRVDQVTLAKKYLEADIWLYPTTSTETYCITALEAQAAQCLCVTTRISALETTVGNRGILIDPGVLYEEQLLQKLFFVLDRPDIKRSLVERGYQFASCQTFEALAEEWIQKFF